MANLDTPKMQALRELAGGGPAPIVAAVVNGASFERQLAPGAFATVSGQNLARTTHVWDEVIFDRALPSTPGGLQVRFNSKAAAVAYVIPADLPAGSVEVEVHTWNSNEVLEQPYALGRWFRWVRGRYRSQTLQRV